MCIICKAERKIIELEFLLQNLLLYKYSIQDCIFTGIHLLLFYSKNKVDSFYLNTLLLAHNCLDRMFHIVCDFEYVEIIKSLPSVLKVILFAGSMTQQTYIVLTKMLSTFSDQAL